MNISRINPFHELYVTETIPPEDFVRLFSPFLVEHAIALFQPGNVVLKGVQGSGKSMLLNLLRPEIRIAYRKQGESLPSIPSRLNKFIGAGINLTRSVAIDFGQRMIESDEIIDSHTLPLYFADFVNYWIVQDIITSIEKLSKECEGEIADEMNLSRSGERLDKFATDLAADRCWFGSLDSVTDYKTLNLKLSQRIATYRAFINFNLPNLPEEIKNTKTTIGEPISKTARVLWQDGIVPRSVPFFIRIDQYEELCHLEDWSSHLGFRFREIINKALSTRDPNISYRIGSRRYAWEEDLDVYGTQGRLELERDYKIVDIDGILRRGENRRTWVFPEFAEDVFERRIQYAGYVKPVDSLRKVIGRGLLPQKKAMRYASSAPEKVAIPEKDWSEALVSFLRELGKVDPLSGKLAEAWVRQRRGKVSRRELRPPYPWTKKWWKKERIQHALMHVAGQYRQRMIWAGRDEVLALSGGNILVFVSLCQHIWASWMQSVREEDQSEDTSQVVPTIDPLIQTAGIQLASVHWYEKIPEKTFHSHRRQRFIDYLGRLFRKKMIDDKKMSYPGSNGFTLRIDDLRKASTTYDFLRTAVDYGDLFDAPHTTKTRDRKKRIKWYLNPILSPYFQIPVVHVKEPMYVSISEVETWLSEADKVKSPTIQEGASASQKTGPQLPLFSSDQLSKKS